MCKGGKKRVYYREKIYLLRKSLYYWLKLPYYDWFTSLDYEKGLYLIVTKRREVRKYLAVLDKLTHQLIFYVIFIGVGNIIFFWEILKKF